MAARETGRGVTLARCKVCGWRVERDRLHWIVVMLEPLHVCRWCLARVLDLTRARYPRRVPE